MDDSQPSRSSDAAATRKRRSSILKSHRPPRAPFSELEFNVATPTDTTKSRRVSFSRRTGVAEFVTNEATTTWKNFYEEHNKTFESSGHEADMKPPRASVGHLGRGMFEQQFQEVEAIDLFSAVETRGHVETSINNIHFTQQISSLECLDDRRLTAPHQKFDMSSLTNNQSKIFGDDLVISGMGEMTDRISVNFSAVQQIGMSEKENDDLDAIERDLQNIQTKGLGSNVIGPGPGPFGQNMSEYIEIDLNMTHAAIKNEESDMSITDTIRNSEVQDISKSNPTFTVEKKNTEKDWITDKENILINPYIAPKETSNFAINDESDKVLVFDGKRLTIQSEKSNKPISHLQNNLPSEERIQRKTIVLNSVDDLPNFIDNPYGTVSQGTSQSSFMHNDDGKHDLSMMQAVNQELIMNADKRKTIVYDGDNGDISVTQAIPSNIIYVDKDALSPDKKPVSGSQSDSGSLQPLSQELMMNAEKRKTIVYDGDNGDISVTQAIPSNIIYVDKDALSPDKKPVSGSQLDSGSLQPLSHPIVSESRSVPNRRNTILYEDDAGQVSFTQALPSNLLLARQSEKEDVNVKRRTIVFETESADISITQAIPSNIVISEKSSTASEKRKTVVYEDQDGNISVTQAADISMTQAIPSNISEKSSTASEKRKTIVYEDQDGNISVTQAVPAKLLFSKKGNISPKERTVVYETDVGDISLTQIIPSDIILPQKCSSMPDRRKTVIYEDNDGNISITQAIPSNVILPHEVTSPEKMKTVVFESDNGNISFTQSVGNNFVIPKIKPVENSNIEYVGSGESVSSEKEMKELLKKETAQLERSAENIVPEKLSSDSVNITTVKNNETQSVFIGSDDKNLCSAQTSIDKHKPVDIQTSVQLQNDNVVNPDPKVSTIQCATSTSFSAQSKEGVHEADASMSEAGDVCEKRDRTINMPSPSFNDKSPEALVKKRLKKTTIAFENDNEAQSLSKPIASYLAMSELEERRDAMKFCQYIPQKIVVYKADTGAHSPKKFDKLSNSSPIDTRSYEEMDQAESTNKISPKESVTSHVLSSKAVRERSRSILDDLLDMSNIDMAEGFDDKSITAKIESKVESKVESTSENSVNYKENSQSPMEREGKSVTNDNSKDSLFFITKDSPIDLKNRDDTNHKYVSKSTDSVDKKKSNDFMKGLEDIKMKLEKFKKHVDDDCALTRRLDSLDRYTDLITDKKGEQNHQPVNAKVASSDLDADATSSAQIPEPGNEKNPIAKKHTTNANNTNDLLDWISEFTDREEEKHPVEARSPIDSVAGGHLAIENKSSAIDTRISLLPRRQSVVLSREDLMNNISMAQAVLQQSRADFEVSEVLDDTETTYAPSVDQADRATQSKKTVRVSNEVVKKLHFDDECTASEDSFSTADIRNALSPVRKTAFGEESYMKDSKANVIPTYLKDVSDGIKQLISDLVKPTADTLPFETVKIDKAVRKAPSTVSLEVQANLMASSQVDVAEFEAASRSRRSSLLSTERDVSPRKTVQFIPEDQFYEPEVVIKPPDVMRQSSDRVLVFDPNNPLNNVLLAPIDFNDVHSYDPVKPDVSPSESTTNTTDNRENDNDNFYVQRLTIEKDCYAINNVATATSMSVRFDTQESEYGSDIKSVPESVSVESESEKISHSSNENSGSPKVDQSIHSVVEMKDVEVNTSIVMKSAEELLKNSSSLTLVDDSLDRSSQLVDPTRGDVRLLYKMNEQDKDLQKTEAHYEGVPNYSPDCPKALDEKSKGSKRNHSPRHKKSHKKCNLQLLDMTPSPASKVKKTHHSPVRQHSEKHSRVDYESTSPSESGKENSEERKSPKRSPRKPKHSPKHAVNAPAVTVQRVDTEYIIDGRADMEAFRKTQLTDVSEESDAVSRVRSTTTDTGRSERSTGRSELSGGHAYSLTWQPELVNEPSSKNLVTECESSANVVAKIDKLPFMGTHECEWKSTSSDTWVFKLLHGRLRLSVRLAHRHDNQARTLVRADTPVAHVALDRTHHENKNPVAGLCVHFAKEAMRSVMSRGVARAGDVPQLLRACAGVAHCALQWGLAMHEAYRHLAFKLSDDGRLELKVANIPLRSVWEVTMRVRMVGGGGEIPWPEATDVDVSAVISDYPVSGAEAARALASNRRDWGHAPRAVWKIFRYLKHKTSHDDLLLFSGR